MWWRSYDSDEVASSFAGSDSRESDANDQTSQNDVEQQYDDEDLEGYSDEFEADDDGDEIETRWRVGSLVQVYWDEETQWFDGKITRVDPTGARLYVEYEDGDEHWETVDRVRGCPPLELKSWHQLQAADRNLSKLLGCRVGVYWYDEGEWFLGTLKFANDPSDEFAVAYDDGDEETFARSRFRNVLFLPKPQDTSIDDESSLSEPVATLVPRAYTPVVTDHFEPVRVARPYKSAVLTHVGSIITPRRIGNSFQTPMEIHLECTMAIEGTITEAQTQTEIISVVTATA